MKSTILLPYCPVPSDTGSRVEMMKHLQVLEGLGECRILSASSRPVGCGWSQARLAEMEEGGAKVLLREDECRRSLLQIAGLGYAAFFKSLGMERAFGHSNPYHRYAFPREWWKRHTDGANLAAVNYSYWAWLPCACPKVVILHDLLSDLMWEGPEREIEDLQTADLVIVISKDEENRLNEWGIKKTLWSPPSIAQAVLPLSSSIGCVGSGNRFNVEGLCWLRGAVKGVTVKVYGDLSEYAADTNFERMGRYTDTFLPYRDCGIVLLPTSGGTGVQIKAVESLACGRAIVARKGAMRGLPEGNGAWIEVERPEEMIDAAEYLKSNEEARIKTANQARVYYSKYLDSNAVKQNLKSAYQRLAGQS